MSEVLERFAEPYVEECDGIEAIRNLYTLAVMAWNVALLPADQRPSEIDRLIEKGFARRSDADRGFARALFEDMVDRKLAHFSKFLRPIVGFDVKDLGGDSYFLSVISGVDMP
jgi:hypothetical protein